MSKKGGKKPGGYKQGKRTSLLGRAGITGKGKSKNLCGTKRTIQKLTGRGR